jgi:hypothetical protein
MHHTRGRPAMILRRARELAVGGCDPGTIEKLLVAEGYFAAAELMTEDLVKELEEITSRLKEGNRPNASDTPD